MLELAVTANVDLIGATKIALGSMMSTARANLSVGPPYDIAVYSNDALTIEEARIMPDSPMLGRMRAVWEKHLLAGIAELPHFTADDLVAPETRTT